jgi:hypothetical protein
VTLGRALGIFAVVGSFVTSGESAVALEPRVIKVHYTPKDQQVHRYAHLPIDVPAGVTRLDIELRYDRAAGENVVDLGLLEPGSLELGTKAFRGWTGGERSEIFVSAADATPGYWPGPVQAGRWHVSLGLYKVGAKGVDVEVTVRTSTEALGGPTPSVPDRSKEPIGPGPAWFSGALHTHTHNSDGALSVQALVAKARDEGLDFIAITDHNNTAHQREGTPVPGILQLAGEEVTTPGGHMNAWGLGGMRDLLDFRILPGDDAIRGLVQGVVARGGVVGINHPFSACVACSWTHAVPSGVSAIEISGREPEEMPRAIALWDILLREGRRVAAVGVSDWHRGDAPIGSASVRVWARDLSTPSILEGLRNGRVVVMLDARTPPPEVRLIVGKTESRIGDSAAAPLGGAYDVVVTADAAAYRGARAELFWNGESVASVALVEGAARFERFAMNSGYLRVHMFSAAGVPLAITNPIWLTVTP